MTVSPEDRQHLITNYHEIAQKIVQEIPVLIDLDQLFTAVKWKIRFHSVFLDSLPLTTILKATKEKLSKKVGIWTLEHVIEPLEVGSRGGSP